MDAAPVGTTISDPSQDDNPLIYANERFETLTGYSEAEICGRNCRFGSDTDPDALREIQNAIDASEQVTVELKNCRKDGSPFWNRLTVAPVGNDDGALLNWVGFQEEIDRSDRSPS